MAVRWCAAGMLEADYQFRRVNGHLHLPKLRAALEAGVRHERRDPGEAQVAALVWK